MLPKLQIIPKIVQISYRKLNFVQKSQWAHMSISPRSEARGLERCLFLKYYNVLKWEYMVHFLDKCCKNYQSYQKIVQIKVVRKWISYKKISERIYLSPPGVELGVSKNCHFWNIIMYWNGKVDSLQGSMLPKISVTSKNTSNKSYWALNFVQKSRWLHKSVSLKSRARGSQRLICFKYYMVLKLIFPFLCIIIF